MWGDWHTHTNYTDGQNTVFEMCEQAVKNNLKLIAFTEHVRRSLDYDFDRFLGDIESARRAYPNLIILAGCEAKVLDTEGNLDVSPEIIKKCDIVVASFHGFPYGEKIHHLTAIKNMIQNPDVDIWGHPTQHLPNHGINLTKEEVDEIIELCKTNKVLIEKNQRYPETHWFSDRALELGAYVVFSSDAHSIEGLRRLELR
ncbi:MAG TPA: PHP domain-containing protein [Candidatus Aenigmarchaeota archaeon]|nr:PHP domain-containing protein [Candidatus Aenigmarchaeota archaeon]